MRLLKNLSLSVYRPFLDLRYLLIGVLLAMPLRFIGVFTGTFIFGYFLKCGLTAFDSKLPSFYPIKETFTQGFFASIIFLIFFLPFLIYKVIFLNSLNLNFINYPIISFWRSLSFAPDILGPFWYLILFVGLCLFLLCDSIYPIALLLFATKGKFRAAFDRKQIVSLFTLEYFLVKILMLIVSVLFAAVYLGLVFRYQNTLPSLAILSYFLISAFSSYTIGVISYTAFGRIFGKKLKNLK